MDIIKEFNNQLNNSFTKRNDEASAFYNQVDVTLKSSIQRLHKTRQALIIGAGKMEEFSLVFFMKYFDKVVVTDIDIDSVNKQVRQMNLNHRTKHRIVTREVEYTGFGLFEFFEDFRKEILSTSSFKDVDRFIDRKIEHIKKYHFLEYEFEKYDFIYVSPIYTQLIYNQVLMECSVLRQKGYHEDLLKYIESRMMDEMIEVIDRFNDNLVSLLHEDGELFVLSDIFEVHVGSDFDLRISTVLNNRDLIDSLYENYRDKYGMGFGDYGLYSLDDKMRALSYKWLKWPFKENTNLIIKLKIYKRSTLLKEVKL